MKSVGYLIALTIILSSCKSVRKIPPPEGEICINDIPSMTAFCEDIKTKKQLPDVPIEKTDSWISMPVSTYNSILDYIDKVLGKVNGDNVTINREELYRLLKDVKDLKFDLEGRVQ
jgi:hypothetical protein